jgi:pyruvate/2-oxoglutarate dehydrogenase complex dihydrolipoamide dehydrogenase (E3) component
LGVRGRGGDYDLPVPPAKGEGTYNVVVLGAGPAGLVTATACAGLGARVALVERAAMGGDCLNTGCVPSKALLSSAKLADRIRRAGTWGLDVEEPRVDFARVMRRVRERRARIEPNDSQERMESLGIDVFRAHARFVSPREVEVEGRRLRARHFVIATGSRPSLPPVDGLADAAPLTTDTVFDTLDARPPRLVVLGGGAVGCELGQAFAALGVQVTLLEALPRLLAREEPEASALVLRRLEAAGARVLTGARVQRIERRDGVVRASVEGQSAPLEAEAVLVAAGRAPNVDDLGLEAAGVAFGPRGVQVDAHLRTSQAGIWAAGDVTGGPQFTHVADHHARVLVRNLVFPLVKAKVDLRVLPVAVYTSPEVARVGLTEEEARRGGDVTVITKQLHDVDRAVVEDEEDGFAKVILDGGRIVGATLVSEHAGELIHELALAMKLGAGVGALSSLVHAYPTLSEVSRKVADEALRGRLTPSRRKALAWLFGKRRG